MSELGFGVTLFDSNERPVIKQGTDAEAWAYSIFWAPEFLGIPTMEPFAVLSAVAQHTDAITLGTGIAGLAVRSPVQMAKAAVTTDILSNGRLVLGLGLGGLIPKDLEVENVPSLKERGRISNERLEILHRLFTERTVSHSGEYYNFKDFTFGPEPVQKPHIPIWLGARFTGKIADAALKRAGTYADVFIFPADTPTTYYPYAKDKVRNYAEAAGRNPDSIGYASTMWTCLGSSREKAIEVANRIIPEMLSVPWVVPDNACYGMGTPEDCIATAEEFADLGVSHIIMNPCCDYEEVTAQTEQFGREVIPHFNSQVPSPLREEG